VPSSNVPFRKYARLIASSESSLTGPFRHQGRLLRFGLRVVRVGTFCASTTKRFYDSFKIFLAVIVGDLFTRIDIPFRPDPNSLFTDKGFSIRLARVINVSRNIATNASINRPLRVYAEKVFASSLIDFAIWDPRAYVLNDSLTFGN